MEADAQRCRAGRETDNACSTDGSDRSCGQKIASGASRSWSSCDGDRGKCQATPRPWPYPSVSLDVGDTAELSRALQGHDAVINSIRFTKIDARRMIDAVKQRLRRAILSRAARRASSSQERRQDFSIPGRYRKTIFPNRRPEPHFWTSSRRKRSWPGPMSRHCCSIPMTKCSGPSRGADWQVPNWQGRNPVRLKWRQHDFLRRFCCCDVR